VSNLLDTLTKVANNLDAQGHSVLADRVDSILRHVVAEGDYDPEAEERRLEQLPESLTDEEERAILRQHTPKIPERRTRLYEKEMNFLIKEDIFPVETSDSQAFLGRGAFGRVYQAVCGPSRKEQCGGTIAVKVLDPRTLDEGKVWKAVLNIAEKMPPELKKHIPTIYDIVETESAPNFPMTLILMEKLKPLTGKQTDLIFPTMYPESEVNIQPADIMKNEDLLFMIEQEITKPLSDDITDLPDFHSNMLKAIMRFHPDPSHNLRGVAEAFSRHMTAETKKIIADLQLDENQYGDLGVETVGSVMSSSSIIMHAIVRAGGFPLTAPEKHEEDFELDVYREIPETATLTKALEFLRDNGVYWGDLNRRNLMVRPSTGDLVIIDVGLYKVRHS
jgi:serine/threonine protein kinase